MAEYINRSEVLDSIDEKIGYINYESPYQDEIPLVVSGLERARDSVENALTADVVEIETLKAWLYKIAIENVGCCIDGDFSEACEELISRLDGLRAFARERGATNDLM